MDSLIRASRSGGALDDDTLRRIDAVGVNGSETDGLVREVLTTTLDVLSCESSLLLLPTEEDGFRLYAAVDDGVAIGMPFTESETILTRALEAGRPVVIEGVGERSDAGAVLTRMFRAQRVALAPLQAGAETLGLLGAVDPIGGAFDEIHGTALGILAGRAAVAFFASRRLGELRSEVDDSEFLLTKLYDSDRNKTELLSVVSHEIRGPISNIVGFAEVLRGRWGSLPAARRDHLLDVIAREGQRAARLVEDILDLARLESGSLTGDLRPVAVGDIVDEILSANEALCASHEVTVELDDDLPPALADPDRLGQVLTNLLSNACRYAPPGSEVTIRGVRIHAEDGPALLLSVTDRGPGIPEAEQHALFEKFKRLSTAADAPAGSGLGLYISRGIVEAHGGRIWVKSRSGEGATFFFTLRPA